MKCHRLRHPRNTAQMSRPVLVLNLENFKRCVASRSPAATFLGMARSLRNWSEMAIRIISGQAHYFQKQNPDVDHCRSHMITRQGFFHDIQLKYLANSGFSWPSLLRDSDNVWHDWLQQLHVESWRLFSDHILPHSFRYFLCYIQRSWFFWCSSEKGWLYKKSNLLTWFLYENCQQKCKYRHFWTHLKTILLIKCQMSHQF